MMMMTIIIRSYLNMVCGNYLAEFVMWHTVPFSVMRTEASESFCSRSPSLGLRRRRKSVLILNTATHGFPPDAHAGKNYTALTAILTHRNSNKTCLRWLSNGSLKQFFRFKLWKVSAVCHRGTLRTFHLLSAKLFSRTLLEMYKPLVLVWPSSNPAAKVSIISIRFMWNSVGVIRPRDTACSMLLSICLR